MDDLTSSTGIVALAAAAVALVALAVAIVATVRLRRIEAAQRVVLGDTGERDVVGHVAALDRTARDLHDYVEDVAARLDARLGVAETRLDGAVAHHGLIRYDAYNEMSGRQSTSIALLDASGNGIVLSSIHHRDQARLYAKLVRDGEGALELSPEEREVVDAALAGEAGERGVPAGDETGTRPPSVVRRRRWRGGSTPDAGDGR